MSSVLNAYCPNSGKPVQPDSLTTFRGHEVGFCNTHCRDEFAEDPERESYARTYFEVLIKERTSDSSPA